MRSWLSSLPHQIPFRAASAARQIDDKTIEGEFLCSSDDALLPGTEILQVLVVEALAQLAGGLAFHSEFGHGFLTGIDRCEITRPIEVGDVVHARVTLDAEFGGTFRFSGTAHVDGVECIRGRFYLAAPPA